MAQQFPALKHRLPEPLSTVRTHKAAAHLSTNWQLFLGFLLLSRCWEMSPCTCPRNGGTKALKKYCTCLVWPDFLDRGIDKKIWAYLLWPSAVSNLHHTQLPFLPGTVTFCLAAPLLLTGEPAVNPDKNWVVGLNTLELFQLLKIPRPKKKKNGQGRRYKCWRGWALRLPADSP